ncbi:unnamed protein product [Diplocarpon coronariae]
MTRRNKKSSTVRPLIKNSPDLAALSITDTRGGVSITGQKASETPVIQTEPIPNGRSSATPTRNSSQKSRGNRYKKFPTNGPAL